MDEPLAPPAVATWHDFSRRSFDLTQRHRKCPAPLRNVSFRDPSRYGFAIGAGANFRRFINLIALAFALNLIVAAVVRAQNYIKNGDFSSGLTDYTTTVVSNGAFGPSYPKFEIFTSMFCLPSQNGNPFFAMDVPGGADGYLEQQLTLPNASTIFSFTSWGNLDPVTVTISIITTADGVEHVLDTYTPPQVQSGGGSTCSGAAPIIKAYGLQAFAGKTIRVRIRATSTGFNGTIADFDNLSIIAPSPPVSIDPQVFNGPLNAAVSNDCNCDSFSGTGQWSGDPVNTLTGNLSELAADLVIPGRGRSIELNRTYNAMDAASAAKPGPLGFGWTHSYAVNLTTDTKTGAVTVHQEGGAAVTFSQPKPGIYSAPAYVTATLKAGAGGTLVFTLKNRKADTFNSAGQLISETDRNGYQTTVTYTGSGALATVTDPAGRKLTFTTGTNGLISQVADPLGRKVTYTYDTASNLVAVRNVGGGVTAYTYDAHHRLLTVKNPNGGVTTNVYNAANQITKQTDPAGRTTTWSYTAVITAKNGANTTTITDGAGHVSRRSFASYLLSSLTQGAGSASPSTWTYAYDSARNLASVKDPDGHVSKTSYNALGNLLSQTDALGRTTRTTYNSFNDPLTITDPLGVATTMTYDTHGNLAKVSRPLTGTAQISATTYTHGDPAHPGDVTAVSDPDGNVSTFTYDAHGDLLSRSDPNGNKTTSTYNTIGFLLSTVAPRGNAAGGTPVSFTTSYAYNAYGDATQITDPLRHVTKLGYDANRNLINVTDPNGHQTIYVYNADKERTSIKRPDGTVLKTAYDGAGNVTSQTDALGHTISYTYDAQNRLTVATDALLRATRFAFDASGNRVKSTDPSGEISTYGYDPANELVSLHYSDGTTPAVGFKYDGDGQRISMSDGTGTTSYLYDSLRRVTGETNGAGQKVSYRYDLDGRLTSITYPNGHSVTRSYDKSGRLVSLTDWLGDTTTFSYNPDGKLTGAAYANKWNGSFTFDNADQVTGIAYTHGTQKLSLTYKRDAAERLVSETAAASISGTPAATFPASLIGYDSLNRCVSDSVSAAGYIYDPADRITNDSGALMSYDKADELTSISKAGHLSPLGYDPQGNRTTAAANKLTYDAENRLTTYGTLANYRYNGDGLRIAKVMGATTERYAWDQRQTDLPVIIQDGTFSYVYGPAQVLLERIDAANSVLYYHQDQLGSTRLLTNSTAAVAAAYTYDAYGRVIDSTGTVANPFMYAGQYSDPESGFLYLRGRYYDPATAQFPTRDPLVFHTRQAYAYASDDPINKLDLSGLGGVCQPLGLPGLGDTVNQAIQGVIQGLPASVPGGGVPQGTPSGGQTTSGGAPVSGDLATMASALAQSPALNPTTAAGSLPADATVSPATCSAPQSGPGGALPGSFDVAPAGPPAASEGTGVANPLLMQQQMRQQQELFQMQSQIIQSQNQATMSVINNAK